MRGMFWRFVTGPLGVLLAVVGIPGTAQDAGVWGEWLGDLSLVGAWGLTVVGVILVGACVHANRKALAVFYAKLQSATAAASDAWRRVLPPLRSATWDDIRSTETFESGRWEVMAHTVRKTGLVPGEGRPALIGMAKVKEQNGNRNLYLSMFLDGKHHAELRVADSGRPVVRRHAIVKVDGEVLSEMTFDPCLTSCVSDTRRREGLREEVMHLLDVGDVLSVSVTDTVQVGPGREIDDVHDILRVPLAGFATASAKLRGIANRIRSATVG